MKKIENEEEYQKSLKRFEIVFQADPGTPEGDEANRLADMIMDYENIHFPIEDSVDSSEEGFL